MAEDLWQKHEKDAVNVRMWKDDNPKCVFYYQEHGLDLNEMRQDDIPFTLCIQTDWQFQMMLKYGNGSALSMDFTFFTTETEYPLYTLMAFDKWRNGIPVAFFVISSAKKGLTSHPTKPT